MLQPTAQDAKLERKYFRYICWPFQCGGSVMASVWPQLRIHRWFDSLGVQIISIWGWILGKCIKDGQIEPRLAHSNPQSTWKSWIRPWSAFCLSFTFCSLCLWRLGGNLPGKSWPLDFHVCCFILAMMTALVFVFRSRWCRLDRMWNLIVAVPYHCLFTCFSHDLAPFYMTSLWQFFIHLRRHRVISLTRDHWPWPLNIKLYHCIRCPWCLFDKHV